MRDFRDWKLGNRFLLRAQGLAIGLRVSRLGIHKKVKPGGQAKAGQGATATKPPRGQRVGEPGVAIY